MYVLNIPYFKNAYYTKIQEYKHNMLSIYYPLCCDIVYYKSFPSSGERNI